MPVYSLSFCPVLIPACTEGWLTLSRPGCLVPHRGGLPVQRRSPTRHSLMQGVYCPDDVHWARLEASALGSLCCLPCMERKKRKKERYRRWHVSSSEQYRGCWMKDAAAGTRAIRRMLSSACRPCQSYIDVRTDSLFGGDNITSLYRRTHSLSRLVWSWVYGRLAPFYIHQMNRVNSRNCSAMMTAP